MSTSKNNFARKASKSKQQTQLSFPPLDHSSSPAAAATPSSRGLQPAKVRFERPGGRSKKIVDVAGSESEDVLSSGGLKNVAASATRKSMRGLPQKMFPTPSKTQSSQPQFESGFLDESEDNDATNPTLSHRVMMRKKTGFTKGFEAYKNRALNDADSSGGSEPEEETITPSKRSDKKITAPVTISSDSESDADVPVVASKKKMASTTPVRRSIRNAPIVLDSDDELALPAPQAKKTKVTKPKRAFQRSSSAAKPVDEEDDDEDDDDPIVSSPKRSQRPVFKKRVDTSESESEEEVVPWSYKPSCPVVATPSTEDENEDEEEEEEVVSPLKRRRPVESESESDIVELPAKRQRNARSSTDSESDSESDLDLPIPSRSQSPPPKTSTAPKSRSKPRSESPQRVTRQATRRHRTEKEKALELMRRKRAGEKITQLTDSESSDEENEPEFEELSEFDDEDEEEVVKLRKAGKKAARAGDVEDDDDFVVEDDDEPLGVPLHLIPLEFTHQAHKPLKEHFRDAIEWMVHKKINPAFPKDDPVYHQAFRKLETECAGLAKSKFSSTAWTTAFTHAIYARPEFISGDLEEGEGYDVVTGQPKCDACNHRSHVPSKFIQLRGKAYEKDSLDELEQVNEDSDGNEWESDDEERVERNEKGLKLPAEKTKWFVGRHCFANAEQSHTLIHWRYALYEWVKDALENEGELVPSKLAERERMKAKKRAKYANDLVDKWAEDGQIKDLYRDFKNQVETARGLQQGMRGAWV